MNPGDDYPRNARYGVMCVSGYPDSAASYDRNVRSAAAHSFVFYVVDTAMCAQPLARFTGRGDTLGDVKVQAARHRAQTHASRLNRQDAAHDKAHATI